MWNSAHVTRTVSHVLPSVWMSWLTFRLWIQRPDSQATVQRLIASPFLPSLLSAVVPLCSTRWYKLIQAHRRNSQSACPCLVLTVKSQRWSWTSHLYLQLVFQPPPMQSFSLLFYVIVWYVFHHSLQRPNREGERELPTIHWTWVYLVVT